MEGLLSDTSGNRLPLANPLLRREDSDLNRRFSRLSRHSARVQ